MPTSEPELKSTQTAVRWLRLLAAATLVIAFGYMVVHTIHWPLMQDAQVLHYVNFLIDHGFAPYRDIGDLNMPGAYLMERLSMVVFGPGDLGFRLYDLAMMIALIFAMIAIAWPYDWLAGLFAGVLFATIHAADGPKGAGQRDEVMAVLIVIGYAFLFLATRRQAPRWMAAAGFFFGMAATVKPTIAPLGLLLLLMVWLVLRRRTIAAAPFLAWGAAGVVIAAGLSLGFLLRHRAFADFLYALQNSTLYYAGINRTGFIQLLRECMPRPMRLLVPFGLAAAWLNLDRTNWERWAVALGVAFGAFSYFAQGKGFYYQRYPLIAMTLLWFGIELTLVVRRSRVLSMVGTAGLAIGIFGLSPLFAERSRTVFYSNIFTETLESELHAMGTGRLQRNIQCLDMVDGCMNALYHLGIVQQTGRTGDNLLFAADTSLPVVQHDRKVFWDRVTSGPPDVFVLSDEQFLDPASFDKLNRWPEFRDYLNAHYDLYTAHQFPITVAYRIYVRKGSFADLPRL